MTFRKNFFITLILFVISFVSLSKFLSLLVSVSCNSIPKQSEQEIAKKDITSLQMGNSVEMEFRTGESHLYQINLKEDDFIKVVLEQQGVDLTLSIPNTNIKFDRENGTSGIEELFFIAEETRDYLICVSSDAKAAHGSYLIQIETNRKATQQDKERIKNYYSGKDNYQAAQKFLDERNFSKAKEYFEYALSYYEKAEDFYWQAVVFNKLGVIYLTSDSQNLNRDLNKSIDHFNKSINLRQIAQDAWGKAESLSNLAVVYSILGEKKEASTKLEEAIPLHHKVNNVLGKAKTLNSLGLLYANNGQFDKAIEIFDDILKIPYENNNDFLAFHSAALNSKARLCSRLGDHQKALEFHLENLSFREKVGNTEDQAITYHNIGLEYLYLKNFEAAEVYFNKAKKQSNDVRLKAYSDDQLGVCYWSKKDYKKGLEYTDKALETFNLVKDSVGKASAFYHKGSIYFSLKDYIQSRDNYKNALEIREKNFSKNEVPAILYGLALANQKLGDLEEAKNNLQKAISIIESQLSDISAQDYRLSFFSTAADYYKLLSELLMELHKKDNSKNFDVQALEMSELGRARSLLDLLIENKINFRKDKDKTLLEKEKQIAIELKDQRLRLSELTDDVKELERKYSQVVLEIKENNPEYGDLRYPKQLSLSEINQKILDKDTIILEYLLGEERSYLWLLQYSDSETKKTLISYELPKRSEIEEIAKQLYCDLTIETRRKIDEPDSIFEKRKKANSKNYIQSAINLGNILLGHVAKQLGTKRLLIVPDGILQYIPFAVLAVDSNKAESYTPLVVDHEIIYMPSISTLGKLRMGFEKHPPATNLLAIFADPVFEITNSDNKTEANIQEDKAKKPNPFLEYQPFSCNKDEFLLSYNTLRPLLGTQEELKLILKIAATKGLCLSKQGAEVNRSNLITSQLLSQYKIVHFATHGIINDKSPELSAIALSKIDKEGKKIDEPFLRLKDIYNLNLSAELIVLSACQTGIGPSINGEGIVSFSRGFMHAGARRVMTSLWPLKDKTTPIFMEKFYKALLEDNLTPSKALQKVQKDMYKGEHPFNWAAFIIQGEWSGTIK